MINSKVVLEYKSVLGECPVWDSAGQRIFWVDVFKNEIHQFYINKQIHRIITIDQKPGSIALTNTGKLIAALQNGFGLINPDNGDIKMVNDTEAAISGNRFNDGKCDPKGRFWAGSMSLTGKRGMGNLYSLGQNGKASLEISGVSVSNGMAWSLDHKIFYYIDTPTGQVVAYDYDNISGSISNKREVITIPKQEGVPDGMTIDTEGMLWIALWGGGRVSRWNPIEGKVICSIPLPVTKVTSCVFGGDDLCDLYITTAKVGLTEHELKEQPLAGALFVIKNSGFKGVKAYEFQEN